MSANVLGYFFLPLVLIDQHYWHPMRPIEMGAEVSPPNKSLQATRDGASSSASRFTLAGPACLSSGR
jgi:hypothetical protein